MMTDDAKLIERLRKCDMYNNVPLCTEAANRLAALTPTAEARPGDVTAANQSSELIALAKYLAHLAGWETEPIPKKFQSEASAIRAALYAAGYKIMAREPTEAMKRAFWESGPTDEETFGAMWDAAL